MESLRFQPPLQLPSKARDGATVGNRHRVLRNEGSRPAGILAGPVDLKGQVSDRL